MRLWRVRFLVAVAVVTLVTGGCSGVGGSDAPASVGDGGEPQAVTIVAVDYAYKDAPLELEGGVIDLRFENRGTVGHEVALAGIGDSSVDGFVKDLGGGTGLEGKPFPDYLDQVAVPPFVSAEGGDSAEATFTLSEGRYALFCSISDVAKGDEKAPHYRLGMIRELTVAGGSAEPALPEADGTITATDYGFEVDLQAGDRSVNFVNEGPDQVHVTAIEMYPDGVDAAEAERAFESQLEPGPLPKNVPTAEEGLGFSGIFSDGLGARVPLVQAVESGRTYLFACWIADRAGGAPHAIAYDMYEIVTIE
jgi:plastocyanin